MEHYTIQQHSLDVLLRINRRIMYSTPMIFRSHFLAYMQFCINMENFSNNRKWGLNITRIIINKNLKIICTYTDFFCMHLNDKGGLNNNSNG